MDFNVLWEDADKTKAHAQISKSGAMLVRSGSVEQAKALLFIFYSRSNCASSSFDDRFKEDPNTTANCVPSLSYSRSTQQQSLRRPYNISFMRKKTSSPLYGFKHLPSSSSRSQKTVINSTDPDSYELNPLNCPTLGTGTVRLEEECWSSSSRNPCSATKPKGSNRKPDVSDIIFVKKN